MLNLVQQARNIGGKMPRKDTYRIILAHKVIRNNKDGGRKMTLKNLKGLLITAPLLLFLAGCGNAEKASELIENGNLALEHKEYSLAADYYEQALDVEPDNLEAKYGLEDVFEKALNQKDHDLARSIYSYTDRTDANGEKLSRLQDMIIEYDKKILDNTSEIMMVAFFDPNNTGTKELSDINMTLGSFINNYDSGFREEFLSVYPNGASDIEQDIVYFEENNAALNYAPKVYINIHETAENNFDVCLYVKDHMKDESGNPKVFSGTYDSNCQNYSDELPEEKLRERVSITLFTKSMNGDITEILDTGTAYDKTGDYWVLLNYGIPIPEQMWGAVLYNQTDNEYYAVVYGGSILIDADEAEMLVQLSREDSCMAVPDYFGYWK